MRLARGQPKLPGLLIARLKSLYLIGPEIQKEILPRGRLSKKKKLKLVLLTIKNNRDVAANGPSEGPEGPPSRHGENLPPPLSDIRVIGKQNCDSSEVEGHRCVSAVLSTWNLP